MKGLMEVSTMAFDPAGLEQIAGHIRTALQSADPLGYRDLLDPNVTWGAPDDMNSGCRNLRRSDGSLPLRPHRVAGQGWRTASTWGPSTNGQPTHSRRAHSNLDGSRHVGKGICLGSPAGLVDAGRDSNTVPLPPPVVRITTFSLVDGTFSLAFATEASLDVRTLGSRSRP
jgi:hypothetical protein